MFLCTLNTFDNSSRNQFRSASKKMLFRVFEIFFHLKFLLRTRWTHRENKWKFLFANSEIEGFSCKVVPGRNFQKTFLKIEISFKEATKIVASKVRRKQKFKNLVNFSLKNSSGHKTSVSENTSWEIYHKKSEKGTSFTQNFPLDTKNYFDRTNWINLALSWKKLISLGSFSK